MASFSVHASLTTNLVAYYDFDTDATDSVSSNDGTVYGATHAGTGILSGDYSFTTNDYIAGFTDWFDVDTDDYTMNIWIKTTDITSSKKFVIGMFTARIRINGDTPEWNWYDGDQDAYLSDSSISADTWYMLTITVEQGVGHKFYLNAGTPTTNSETGDPYAGYGYTIGALDTDGGSTYANFFEGEMDEVGIWDRVLTPVEISDLYNSGSGLNPVSGGGTSPPFEITAINSYDSLSITSFSAYLNNTLFSTNNGTIVTDVLWNSTTTHNIELSSTEDGGYFNHTYNAVDVSSNMEGELHQAEINLTATQFLTSTELFGIFKNISDDTLTLPMYINAGIHNFTFVNSSYYSKTQSFNIPNLYNDTLIIENVTSTILNVTAVNAFSSETLLNLSGWVYNIDQANNISFDVTTGYFESPAINGNYTVYLESDGYAIGSQNYKNITVNNPLEFANFSLWSNNSIRIYLYDEATSEQIIGTNITVTVTGNSTENSYYTTTGFKFVENLQDGDYTIKFSGGNYTTKNYVVTVADRSTQRLNAYLSASYQTVIFTVSDQYSLSTLEGVSITSSRLINSTYVVTESKATDVTGRAQLSYLPNVKYKYILGKSGYVSKTFYLDPVIFNSYSVLLTPLSSSNNSGDFVDVGIVYYPKYFINGAQNNLTFQFASPNGVLSLYGFNITYPGGSLQHNGSNSIGEEFNVNFTITGANINNYVNVTYWYDSTIGPYNEFHDRYSIYGAVGVGNNTIGGIKNSGFDGLGVFEKALIGILFIMIISGLAFMLGGLKVSGVAFILMATLFSFLGFLPLWSILPAALVAFILIIGGNT